MIRAARPPHSSRRSRQAGFTFVETAIVSVIFLSLVTMFARALGSSNGVMRESRVVLRAREELRRNLDAIANCFRGASLSSLSNFDASFTSTAPGFRCVTGVDGSGACVLDAAQTMQWQAPSGGAAASTGGQVVVVRSGVTTSVATRVPAGGFRAVLEGTTLRVQLTTTYRTSAGATTSVSGDVSVTLRN